MLLNRDIDEFRLLWEFETGTTRFIGIFFAIFDLVCCRNISKETHKLLDPDKPSVVKSLSFSRVIMRKLKARIYEFEIF